MTRVSDSMFYNSISRNLSTAQKRAYDAQAQATSGLRVNKLSDDPIAASRASLLDNQLSRLSTMDSVSARTASQVDVAGTALDQAISLVSSIRSSAESAANGAEDASGMTALGVDVGNRQQALLATANTDTESGYVFAGNLTTNQPFLANGTYVGDAGVHTVEVAPNTQVQANVSGAQAFTAAGGVDVFSVVETVRAALMANDPATVKTQLGNLDTALAQLKTARVQLGASTTAIQSADSTRATMTAQLQSSYDSAMKIDDTTASVNMLSAQNSLQAAASMASSVLSLLTNLGR